MSKAVAVSLRRRFLYRLWAVVALFVVALGFSLWVVTDTARTDRAAQLEFQIVSASKHVARRLDYYRAALRQLAGDPRTHDELTLGTTDTQHAWAEDRIGLFPGALGVALLDPAGHVLGDAGALHIGKQCQADLVGTPLATSRRLLLVHRERADAAHFDMVEPVRDVGGALLGGAFLSFRVEHLQRVLDDSVYPGHALAIFDARGETVVRSGAAIPLETRHPLGDSGWVLAAGAPPPALTPDQIAVVATAVTTLLIVLAIMVEGIARLRRNIDTDLDLVRHGLEAIASDVPVPALTPQYIEFRPAMHEIELLARALREQRAELARLSLTDALTGQPNRRAFEQRMPQMLGLAQRGHALALVLLDVDHFKQVNDTLGHAAGDRVLLALGAALASVARGSDFSARLAGDEFVILLADLDAAGAHAWYARLADRFEAELRAHGLEVHVSLSAGLVWLESGDSLGRVLARADRTLYQAKGAGRARLVIADAASDKTDMQAAR